MAYHSNGGYSGDERESRSGDDRPDSDISDKPIYILEHLATFTVNKETGIVYPADGMRRLLQLEKTTGIWSQKMQLCLDNQWVLIMDYESGNVIERFPASLIQEPTAFTSNDPMEMYNNILVFVVAGGPGSRSEMHIFQSQNVSAVHLVEDLKQLRNGKIVTQHRETIPPPPMKTSQLAGRDRGIIDRDRDRDRDRDQLGGVVGSSYQHETDSELGGINDETSSTSSDRYERDVTVLNHCFDDIEKFIARLQHAAAASRELERRRRNKKSKKRDPGEGLLTLRTRPPHEKEFVDIFAKFKLSFNLLAKLKAHIHDPNAPELVHFLFTPLALIVEASSDTYYESHLPARVVNPLLTREAVNLLINCVTSKETELWRSLGDAWTIPRDQWKGHVGSYHPVFFDGWSPDYPVVDELEARMEHSTTPNTSKRHNFSSIGGSGGGPGREHVTDYDLDGATTPNSDKYNQHHHRDRDRDISGIGGGGGGGVGGVRSEIGAGNNSGFRDFSARSDISVDSIERNGINQSGPTNGNGPNNTSSNSNNAAIQSLVGGIQRMGGDLQSSGSVIGQDRNIDNWLEELQARGAKIVQVTYPRTANNDKELTVVRGEFLEIVDDSRKWWKARNSRGQIAHVPHTIVTPYNYNDNGDIFNNPIYGQNYGKNSRQNDPLSERYTQSGENSSQPGIAPNSAEWVRNKHLGKKGEFRYF